ncbi:MAG: hypothetical protein U5Q03_06250 [Bacteroidota bacterium]|nr:hypothetical protein [Bacteroidota bacterium]
MKNQIRFKHLLPGLFKVGNQRKDFYEKNDSNNVYGGLSLGYSIWNTKYDGPGEEYKYEGSGGSGLYLYLQAGGRYFFTDRFAVNLQLGAGSTAGARIGITYLIN